jgi:beta-glucanase (GH16 family)
MPGIGTPALHGAMRARLARTCRQVAAVTAFCSVAAVPAAVGGASSQSSPWRSQLVFRDEFNGAALDKASWHTCFWWHASTCSIETNRELELYNPADVSVGGGALRLRAQRRELTAWNGAVYHYTSGMVMSGARKRRGFKFTYGYAEARLRVPKGNGLWPALWLLPADGGSRPEIDVMEILGDSTRVQHMHFHYVGPDGRRADSGAAWAGPDFAAGWHTFGIEWVADEIVWYVDRVPRWRFTDSRVIPDEPMYLVANLAVGGDWPGVPDATTPFPSNYLVDYVRVWAAKGRR